MTKPREIRQKILKITDLALEVSPPEENHTTEPDVFIYYSPHIPIIDVVVYKSGWSGSELPDEKFSIFTCEDEATEHLDVVIKYLRELREEMNNEQN